MDDAMKQQLLDWVKETGNAVKEQIPATFRDIIIAGEIQFALLAILGFLLVIFGIISAYRFRKTLNDDARVGWAIGMIIGSLGGFAMSGAGIYWFLVAKYAPRAYILDTILSWSNNK